MLSKTGIVITGLLCDENLSAYDMIKKMNSMDMKYWVPIGDTTLYEAVLRLEKKGYIEDTVPENKKSIGSKVIYSLTSSGKKELMESLSQLFLRVDYDTIWFSLATLFCGIFTKTDILILINKRRSILKQYLDGTSKHLNEEAGTREMSWEGVCSLKRMIQIIEFEEDALDELEKGLK